MEAHSKEAFPPRGFVSPDGDTRHPGWVGGGLFGTCNMFWFLEADDVTGITAEITTHRARDRQEKMAHPPRPTRQRRALIKIMAQIAQTFQRTLEMGYKLVPGAGRLLRPLESCGG